MSISTFFFGSVFIAFQGLLAAVYFHVDRPLAIAGLFYISIIVHEFGHFIAGLFVKLLPDDIIFVGSGFGFKYSLESFAASTPVKIWSMIAGGPIASLSMTAGLYWYGVAKGSQFALGLGLIISITMLFNMLTIPALDGGKLVLMSIMALPSKFLGLVLFLAVYVGLAITIQSTVFTLFASMQSIGCIWCFLVSLAYTPNVTSIPAGFTLSLTSLGILYALITLLAALSNALF